MGTNLCVADLALELRSGDQRRHRIKHNYVESIGAHQRLANPERFLPRARLRDEQVIKVDTEPLCVRRVERMLDIDKCRKSTALLCLGDHSKSERCLSGRLRAKHFDNSAAWKSADPQRAIDQNVARRNNIDVDDLLITQSHDCPIAVILSDLLNCQIEILISRGSDSVF